MPEDSTAEYQSPPSLREALAVWVKIGLLSFGGPTGQIALMHRELVERRRWVSDDRFLHALNYCMLLPGPEAQQLSIYIGWLLHRVWGGIIAGTLFVLPGAFLLWLVSYIYCAYGQVGWIDAIFYGLKPAVLAIVAAAVLRIGKKALKNAAMWSLATLAFIGIFFLKLPFPLIVLSALALGLIGGRYFEKWFLVIKGHGGEKSDEAHLHAIERPKTSQITKTILLWLTVWAAPLVIALLAFGPNHVLFAQGIFFSKAAVVTFGGAYAVLPYVAQQAVENYGWLTAPQMLDGLGLAETTPGPLILVLQFVGFLGGWNSPEPLSPFLMATACAVMTTWVTFVPGFLFIFLGAPYIEALRGKKILSCGLSAVTASVVGVVLNLAVWFGWHIISPEAGVFDFFAIAVALAAFVAMQRFKIDVIPIVVASAVLGLVWRLFG